MTNDKAGKLKEVGSYTVTASGAGSIDVTVTSGTLIGKRARLIPMPPAAAYFNLPEASEKKRAD